MYCESADAFDFPCKRLHKSGGFQQSYFVWGYRLTKNLQIRDGVVDGDRGGRVHVDVFNTGASRLIIAPGAVLGQFVREPFLSL